MWVEKAVPFVALLAVVQILNHYQGACSNSCLAKPVRLVCCLHDAIAMMRHLFCGSG